MSLPYWGRKSKEYMMSYVPLFSIYAPYKSLRFYSKIFTTPLAFCVQMV